MIYIEEGMFIDDTMPQYMAVMDDMAPFQRDNLCEKVYNWLLKHKRGEEVNEQYIIERLLQFRPYPKAEKTC